jgi:acetoin:2,6-dichlorophenolindophenol oxidoreductase subunit beta
MSVKTIRQALQEALIHEMRRDPRVVIIGEDVSGGAGTEGGRDAAAACSASPRG